MDDIKQRVLNRAIKMLDGLNLQYMIVDEDGKQYGEIRKRKRRSPLKYPIGTIWKHIELQIGGLPNVGEVKEVNCGEFEPDKIQSCIAAKANKNLGAGAVTTSINRKNNTLKVYRVY